jgi:hypothetical protein
MPQIIEDRYIDRTRLINLLINLFPRGDFTAEVCCALPICVLALTHLQCKLNRWIIDAPRLLTQVGPSFPHFRLAPTPRNT